ncbi:signal recognition particle receptor subunit beta [Pectinophora gossypiella]|uniref:Signal recognition particle receptor subunit beta n=1 Tax=Pectinophora gossypiella TaxID=13191 RepID=A0A1E1WR94_PECGO|nr:signal recognition particle receptor subunit beta [Pectinophora gossypiella]
MDTQSDVVKEKIHTEPYLNDPVYITLLSLLVLILTLLFWWFIGRRHVQRRSVLLMGLSDSGKTLLFVRMVFGQYRQSFTSMKENVSDYLSINSKVRIVDLPGEERLRMKYFDSYKDMARGIVYVVDSVTIQKDIRDVAEWLYTILVDKTVQSACPPILILCNKQDQPLAKGSQVVKNLLEKELNLVRVTKSSQLESVDPSQADQTGYLGKQGKDFEFSQLRNRVDFAEASANTGDDDQPTDLQALEEWIAAL